MVGLIGRHCTLQIEASTAHIDRRRIGDTLVGRFMQLLPLMVIGTNRAPWGWRHIISRRFAASVALVELNPIRFTLADTRLAPTYTLTAAAFIHDNTHAHRPLMSSSRC